MQFSYNVNILQFEIRFDFGLVWLTQKPNFSYRSKEFAKYEYEIVTGKRKSCQSIY